MIVHSYRPIMSASANPLAPTKPRTEQTKVAMKRVLIWVLLPVAGQICRLASATEARWAISSTHRPENACPARLSHPQVEDSREYFNGEGFPRPAAGKISRNKMPGSAQAAIRCAAEI
jgi:hypothetical protein